MNKSHIHAELIKTWADGAEIEWFDPVAQGWISTSAPCWSFYTKYRVKPQPHKWQKEIDAQAAGKQVQRFDSTRCVWENGYWFAWDTFEGVRYRIKPEPVVQKWYVDSGEHLLLPSHLPHNLKLTFEGGELIAAEVLK